MRRLEEEGTKEEAGFNEQPLKIGRAKEQEEAKEEAGFNKQP